MLLFARSYCRNCCLAYALGRGSRFSFHSTSPRCFFLLFLADPSRSLALYPTKSHHRHSRSLDSLLLFLLFCLLFVSCLLTGDPVHVPSSSSSYAFRLSFFRNPATPICISSSLQVLRIARSLRLASSSTPPRRLPILNPPKPSYLLGRSHALSVCYICILTMLFLFCFASSSLHLCF